MTETIQMVVWYLVACYVCTNVSEEHTVSIWNPEDGGSMFFRNIGIHLQDYTVLQTEPTQNLASMWLQEQFI
jgi:hypothetical protein